MRYEMMLPHQIRTAIEKRWPVVLPLGVLDITASIWRSGWIRSR
jgi:hypothetical protein